MKSTDEAFPPEDEFDDDDLLKYCCPSASWKDMTGLIPYRLYNQPDAGAYNEIYPFEADDESKML